MEQVVCRRAVLADLPELLLIEQACFSCDRLSKRSFRRHIDSEHSELLVVVDQRTPSAGKLLGYGLVLLRKGTRLARLYSLAVVPQARGLGVASRLLAALEDVATGSGRLYMRLEVAKGNQAAIRLYEAGGYRIFGEYSDYYEDHGDALRMQKKIRHVDPHGYLRTTPWYRQTTEFTCGPASMLMVMASLTDDACCTQQSELDIWREATTVFMTSGHGGTHPMGLALAARRRGFRASVWVNTEQPLFLNGVRSEQKKQVMTVVHDQFVGECQDLGVGLHFGNLEPDRLEQLLRDGHGVVVLISTYRLDGRKAPHWVAVTGIDDRCVYVHDPDLDEQHEVAVDCQYLPIARGDFERMSTFGSDRLRAAVGISVDPGFAGAKGGKTAGLPAKSSESDH